MADGHVTDDIIAENHVSLVPWFTIMSGLIHCDIIGYVTISQSAMSVVYRYQIMGKSYFFRVGADAQPISAMRYVRAPSAARYHVGRLCALIMNTTNWAYSYNL